VRWLVLFGFILLQAVAMDPRFRALESLSCTLGIEQLHPSYTPPFIPGRTLYLPDLKGAYHCSLFGVKGRRPREAKVATFTVL